MSKLKEARQAIQETEQLIRTLKDELDNHRNLLFRMYLKHGGEMQDGFVDVPDTLQFGFENNSKEARIYITDGEKIKPLKTKYQEILLSIEKLT